jgi:hypothetical protein
MVEADAGLPGPVTNEKMPFNLCFIHGPIALRASNLAK